MLHPTSMLFSSTLILGVILTISSSSWFSAWMGLELNLLSFLAIISVKNNEYSSEASIKYFIIQALASLVILLSALLINLIMNWTSLTLIISLLLKSGAAPFHFWFPVVMESLNWPHATILMTIQKIAPLSLLSYLPSMSQVLFLTSIFSSAIIGALGGLNQTSLRKLLTYSSINHMAWMLSAILMSELLWLTYLIIYSLMTASITLLFFHQQSFHISSLILPKNSNIFMKIITFSSLLSLSGLPPFTGFFIKWALINNLVLTSNFLPLFILLASSLVTLFFYIRIISFSLFISYPTVKWIIKKSEISFHLPIIITLNFLGLFVPSMPTLMA